MKFIIITAVFITFIELCSCSQEIFDKNYKEDYRRTDLIYVLGSGSINDDLSEVWKVSELKISTMPFVSVFDLVERTRLSSFIATATAHGEKRFGSGLQFSGFEVLDVVNKLKQNPLLSNGWVVIVHFQKPGNNWYQAVPVLSDGSILLSSNE